MVQKTFDPITREVDLYNDGIRMGVRIYATLSLKGITLEADFDYDRVQGYHINEGMSARIPKKATHLSPREVENTMLGFPTQKRIELDPRISLVIALREGYCWSLTIQDVSHWGQQELFSTLEMAQWWGCIGFPNEQTHREVHSYLLGERAAHLIPPPPEVRPEPEVVIPEVVDAEYEDRESAVAEESSTSVVLVEHVIEQPKSVTGLGLRRFVKSGINFARDVAVDVASRTISRVMTGQG